MRGRLGSPGSHTAMLPPRIPMDNPRLVSVLLSLCHRDFCLMPLEEQLPWRPWAGSIERPKPGQCLSAIKQTRWSVQPGASTVSFLPRPFRVEEAGTPRLWLRVPRAPQPYACLEGQGPEPRSHLAAHWLAGTAGYWASQDHSLGSQWVDTTHLYLQGGSWRLYPMAFLGAEKMTTGEGRQSPRPGCLERPSPAEP